ncbi:MAG TPA: hypothetical protein VI452_12155 [Marmoricola sp.]
MLNHHFSGYLARAIIDQRLQEAENARRARQAREARKARLGADFSPSFTPGERATGQRPGVTRGPGRRVQPAAPGRLSATVQVLLTVAVLVLLVAGSVTTILLQTAGFTHP